MVQKYQNEIAPIFYYGISKKLMKKTLPNDPVVRVEQSWRLELTCEVLTPGMVRQDSRSKPHLC